MATDLEETRWSNLVREINRRIRANENGCCSYCAQPLNKHTCKFKNLETLLFDTATPVELHSSVVSVLTPKQKLEIESTLKKGIHEIVEYQIDVLLEGTEVWADVRKRILQDITSEVVEFLFEGHYGGQLRPVQSPDTPVTSATPETSSELETPKTSSEKVSLTWDLVFSCFKALVEEGYYDEGVYLTKVLKSLDKRKSAIVGG